VLSDTQLFKPYKQRREGAITFQWQVIVSLDAASKFEKPVWTKEFASSHDTAAIDQLFHAKMPPQRG
jgi:hypothetical protein